MLLEGTLLFPAWFKEAQTGDQSLFSDTILALKITCPTDAEGLFRNPENSHLRAWEPWMVSSLGRLVAVVCYLRSGTLRDTLRRYLLAKLFLGPGNESGFVIPS